MLTKKQKQLQAVTPPRKRLTNLFEHQEQCIEVIEQLPEGSRSLVVMATGLGKTGTFTSLPANGGKTLILADGREVVLNPAQYYDIEEVGVEMGEFRAKKDFPYARIILASVKSLVHRLSDYDPYEFRTIIVDEAHHAVAPSYQAILDYFKPKYLLGFTATPNRSDGVGLDSVFDNIIFKRDLKWAIKNGLLCDICPTKVKIDVDLRNVKAKKQDGDSVADFSDADLAKAMAHSAPVLRDIYKEYAFGPTIINVAGVAIAHELEELIKGSVAITGDMSPAEREVILNDFRNEKIPCLISVGVLKEGVDLPCTQTVIMARPTLSSLLYTQIVGRGLRIYPGKKYLNLVEVEGVLGPNVTLCSAPSLFGIDLSLIPEKDRNAFNKKLLTEMEDIARNIMEAPENWVLSERNSIAWADVAGYDLHNVKWLMLPDGSFELTFPTQEQLKEGQRPRYYRMSLPPPDALGRVVVGQTRFPFQIALDLAKAQLDYKYSKQRSLWNTLEIKKKWGNDPASEKQKWYIQTVVPEMDTTTLTKYQASEIISKIKKKQEGEDTSQIIPIYPVNPEGPPKHYSSVEVVSVNGERFEVYDFDAGPGFPMNVKKKALVADFSGWLQQTIYKGFAQCGNDVDALIRRLNPSKREHFAFHFLRANKKYSYICSLDDIPISRQDLIMLLAAVADQMLPAIIYTDILHPGEGLSPAKVKPNFQEEPLCNFKFQFPSTELAFTKSMKRSIPQHAAEIRQKNKEQWLAKERKKNAAKSTSKSK